MEEALRTLKSKRLGMILLNLAYFAALLVLGALIFLRGVGGLAYVGVAVCIALYLLVVRPVSKGYTQAVREAIFAQSVCAGLDHYCYSPKQGVTVQAVQGSGLVPTSSPKSFLSREHITGRAGNLQVELADVTFPVVEEGRNAMFSGSYLCLSWPGARFEPLTVKGGQLDGLELPKRQREILEQMAALIPGNLYLSMAGERLELLLRGRFLGFPINPLMPVTQHSLSANPYPELEQAIQFARLRRMERH